MITCHIATISGARWSYHHDAEDLRSELVQYWNEVRAPEMGDAVPEDTAFEAVLDLIEESENVSIDFNGPYDHIETLATQAMESEDVAVMGWHEVAGNNHRVAVDPNSSDFTRRLYTKYEAASVLEAVYHFQSDLLAPDMLRVAARVLERADL